MKRKISAIILTLVLSLGFCLSSFAGAMEYFPAQSQISFAASYTRGLQVMLLNHNYATQQKILYGGIDGSYGPTTKDTVMLYQASGGLAVDGSCGPATWTDLRNTLIYTSASGGYSYYQGYLPYYSNRYNMRMTNDIYTNWHCYYAGTWYYVG